VHQETEALPDTINLILNTINDASCPPQKMTKERERQRQTKADGPDYERTVYYRETFMQRRATHGETISQALRRPYIESRSTQS